MWHTDSVNMQTNRQENEKRGHSLLVVIWAEYQRHESKSCLSGGSASWRLKQQQQQKKKKRKKEKKKSNVNKNKYKVSNSLNS